MFSLTAYQSPVVDMYAKWFSRAVSAEKVNIIADEINTAGKVRDDWKSSITQLESASSALINVMGKVREAVQAK